MKVAHHVPPKEPTQVIQIGEILWLNKHEAIYMGRHYKPELNPRARFLQPGDPYATDLKLSAE